MQIEKKQEESKLMTQLANDCETAFKVIYNRYHNRIYALSIRYLKTPVLAQEVVQDVFLKLWFERKNMNANLPVEAWLVTVAKNKLINQFKKITKEWVVLKAYQVEKSSFTDDGDSKLMNNDFERQLHSMINCLPQMQKRVFHFAKEDGLSYNEIAAKMQISPLTVKTHMARALEKLRKSLKQYGVNL